MVSSSGCEANRVEKPYGLITRREQQIAYLILDDKRNATPIMLFFHLALNQNGHEFDFSPADLENRYKISRDRWRYAFTKLAEKGYLVADKKKKYRYTFYSLPEKYRGITLIEKEGCLEDKNDSNFEDNVSEPEDIPTDRGMPTDKDRVSVSMGIEYPRRQGEDIPAEEDSNNKDIKDILKDIKLDDYKLDEDDERIYPKDEELVLEKEALVDTILAEFDNIEDCPFRIMNVESKAKRSRYNIKEHIRMLTELLDKMRAERIYKRSALVNCYQRALESTMPKDGVEYIKVKLILDRYLAEHKSFPKNILNNFGMWVDGWNADLQEPNMIVALYPLPEPIIVKMKHDTNGIPKEYYIHKNQ